MSIKRAEPRRSHGRVAFRQDRIRPVSATLHRGSRPSNDGRTTAGSYRVQGLAAIFRLQDRRVVPVSITAPLQGSTVDLCSHSSSGCTGLSGLLWAHPRSLRLSDAFEVRMRRLLCIPRCQTFVAAFRRQRPSRRPTQRRSSRPDVANVVRR